MLPRKVFNRYPVVMDNMPSEEQRNNQSFHMKPSIALAGREYARLSRLCNGELVEKAFIEYMKNHPPDNGTIIIQQIIKSDLPSRQEKLTMQLITRDAEYAMKRLDELEDGYYPELKEALIKCLRRGVKIKGPTEKFVELLERVETYV